VQIQVKPAEVDLERGDTREGWVIGAKARTYEVCVTEHNKALTSLNESTERGILHGCRPPGVNTYLFYFIYFILFYFILFYFILFYFILFYFILFYFILFYFIVFYCILLYCIVLYFILFLFYFILFLFLFDLRMKHSSYNYMAG
jgi:hypothetical protein